ncbi:MAG: polysaccharide deacetylase family protein [Crocinitomicaceae bacterium]
MIAIFTKDLTERLRYVLDFCFESKGCPYKVISDLKEWEILEDTKFNYSNEILDCDYAIDPSGLLSEEGVDPFLKLDKKDNRLYLRESADPLSIIFYIISRYEEYQPHKRDEHNRFPSSESQQFKLGILKEPIADDIVLRLWKKLGLDYSDVLERFECVPSFDIDVAWAYKFKGFLRTVGGFSKGKVGERLGVLVGGKKDPYDTYGEILNISTQVNRVICFVPVSDWGKYDKNIKWENPHYQSLIRGLNSTGGMGLHPGYEANGSLEKLTEEKDRLEQIVGHEMNKSRFHFLRFDLPNSYELLREADIHKDYSMGFSDNIGFRAGTSFPYYFFNLSTNAYTNLLIFPFAYMDGVLKDKLKLAPEEAEHEIREMMDRVKKVGGLYMCIWHNSSITDRDEWEGWLQVLRNTIKWSLEK